MKKKICIVAAIVAAGTGIVLAAKKIVGKKTYITLPTDTEE